MKTVRNANVLGGFVRAGRKTTWVIFSIVIVVGLFAVWLIGNSLFKLGDRFTRAAKHKRHKQNLKVRHGKEGINRRAFHTIIWAATFFTLRTAQAQTSPTNSATDKVPALKASNTNIWPNGIGEGFKPGTQSISFDAGAGYGVKIFGGRVSHDLALADICYGYMFGPVEGEDHWYRGSWEVRGELFSGGQFSPTAEVLAGLAPHLRYNFATGTRWIPYVDTGAGLAATSIGPPDLSHTFEFNLQAATGIRWFIRDNFALSLEARYLHMSCGGIDRPNLGLNNVNGMVGISWFF